jgi:hypothetical protein
MKLQLQHRNNTFTGRQQPLHSGEVPSRLLKGDGLSGI